MAGYESYRICDAQISNLNILVPLNILNKPAISDHITPIADQINCRQCSEQSGGPAGTAEIVERPQGVLKNCGV